MRPSVYVFKSWCVNENLDSRRFVRATTRSVPILDGMSARSVDRAETQTETPEETLPAENNRDFSIYAARTGLIDCRRKLPPLDCGPNGIIKDNVRPLRTGD